MIFSIGEKKYRWNPPMWLRITLGFIGVVAGAVSSYALLLLLYCIV